MSIMSAIDRLVYKTVVVAAFGAAYALMSNLGVIA